MFSMTPKICLISYFAYEHQIYADFKSMEIIGKKYAQKKLFLPKNFSKLLV
jgi:hypothetical protein